MFETLENDTLQIVVDSFGSQLRCIESKSGLQFLWQGDKKYWADSSPLLFPIVGRLSGQVLRINGKEYNTPKHGFARNMDFELVSKSAERLLYRLTDTPDTLAVYPYRFTLDVEYVLEGDRLDVCFKVINNSDTTMYFSLGVHPGFRCPLQDCEKFSDYYLEFEHSETADRWALEDGLLGRCDKNYLRDQKILELNEDVFKDDALIFKGLKSRSVSLCGNKNGHKVTVAFPDFKHLGIWTRAGGAPFVCIEPWFGYDDVKGFNGDISEKEGIERLNAGQAFKSRYAITCR